MWSRSPPSTKWCFCRRRKSNAHNVAVRDCDCGGDCAATAICLGCLDLKGGHVGRLIVLAMAFALAGCVSSPLKPAAIVQTAPQGAVPARPLSAPQDPGKCIHDEGYGRWTDCGSEM